MSAFQTEPQLHSQTGARTQLFLSFVVPAYNEKDNLLHIVQELETLAGRHPDLRDHEIWVVDDHSSDGIFEWIQSLNNPKVHCLRLSRRSGSHNALRAGLASARGDAVLCIAADGQDDAYTLNEMLEKLQKGTHVVWAVRKNRDEPLLIRWMTALAYRLIDFFAAPNQSKPPLHADFYLLSRKVVDAINRCAERHTSLFGLILWLGFKQDYVAYERRPRRSGKSKWNFASRFRLLIDWIVAFSGLPLKLMSAMGMCVAALGFLYAAFVVFYTLSGYAKPGWAEPVILILVLGGIQMMMLGILGEYLWRTLDETRRRPLYFIEEQTSE